jgi:hypothetical protein
MEKPTSWVYFIQEGADGPIKIGYTGGNPRGRMAALQTGNAKPLNLLAWSPGTQDDEKALHERFALLRMVGEWFRAEEPLLSFVCGVAWTCRASEPNIEEQASCGFSEEQLAFLCGLADGRLAIRASSVALADARISRRLAPSALDMAQFAAAVIDASGGGGPLNMGMAAAMAGNEPTARMAAMKAAIRAHWKVTSEVPNA